MGAEEQLDAAYQEVKEVRTVPRGLGVWGDMVIELRNGNKIELRSLPQCASSPAHLPERRPKPAVKWRGCTCALLMSAQECMRSGSEPGTPPVRLYAAWLLRRMGMRQRGV